jgi:hypothetical protein
VIRDGALMQADTKYALGSVGLVGVLIIGTTLFPALRVLVLPVIVVSILAILFRLARPRSED